MGHVMWKPVIMIFLVIVIGVFGFHFIENWPLFDSLYMTVITIFTVGFKEVRDLSPLGRVFTIFIILGGVGTVLFAFTKAAEIVFEGGMRKFWRRRKMEKGLENLKDHYIICGYGRMGKIVSERLHEENLPFVIIENNTVKIDDLRSERKYLFIPGDATQEEILLQAGIKKARALAALLPSDADNLYLVLTVRLICPSLFVLSKVVDDEAEKKIIQIGANKVVSTYRLSGLKIAQGLIRPAVVDFMDLIIRRKELSLYMEEYTTKKDSILIDKTIAELNIRQRANVIVVAVKKPGKDILFNPPSNFNIAAGDTLLVLGDEQGIKRFEKIFMPSAA
jgi:voltage-gated potassium channel